MIKHYPEPVVGVLISNSKGEILLAKSKKWRNKYSLFGGKVEIGEKIEDAVRREVKEETGLEISDIKFIDFQEAITKKSFWKKKHFIFLDFACKTKSYKDIKLNSENQEFIWVYPKKALTLPLNPYASVTIERYLKNF